MPELPPPPEPPPALIVRLAALARERPRVVAALGMAASLVVGGCVVWVAVRGAPPQPELLLPRATAPTSVEAAEIFVHVAGAVARPGVYRLPRGGRVADVVDAAGGPARDADVHRLNLAARLEDGQRVYVARQGELAPQVGAAGEPATDGVGGAGGGGEGATSGVVDLNAATQAQLEELPGVGPSTAKAILDYRKRNGRFRAVDDLLEVRGIGPAKFEELKDLVKV